MSHIPLTEERQFTVHPAIIKSIIHEQAGSFDKAIAELVMNSVDAGAKAITIEHVKGKLTVRDDGCGFASREEILQVFETFGLPHEDGDATYGRFRVGRGQVMAFGKVSWRSGYYEMVADLVTETKNFGYKLHEHPNALEGCQVTITDNDPDKFMSPLALCGWLTSSLRSAIQYIDVPVTFNGEKITTLPHEMDWQHEDDYAYYKLDRSDWRLKIYNKGVYVKGFNSHEFGVGGVINSKHHMALNMARNTVLYDCPVWENIREELQGHYQRSIEHLQRLKDHEIPALLEWIVESDEPIPEHLRKKLLKVKFIDDVFGNKQSPEKMLMSERFTLYDGVHISTAEHVHRTGMATVIMPKTLYLLYGEATNELAPKFLEKLIQRLRIQLPSNSGSFRPFSFFVKSLDDMTFDIMDKDLSEEEMLILKVLRVLNTKIHQLSGATGRTRKIRAGKSDRAEAWTDGYSYICIDRDILKSVRRKGCGASKMIALMVHEYCHGDASTGTHSHDFNFYQQFHEAILSPQFGAMVDSFFRRYMSALSRRGIQPAGHHRDYVNRFSQLAKQLPARRS